MVRRGRVSASVPTRAVTRVPALAVCFLGVIPPPFGKQDIRTEGELRVCPALPSGVRLPEERGLDESSASSVLLCVESRSGENGRN